MKYFGNIFLNKGGEIMESLLDPETRFALENMAKPLKDKLVSMQNKVLDTLELLENLRIDLYIRHKVLPKYRGVTNEKFHNY